MKSGFGLFLDFGTSDRLDIAYYDSAKRFLTCGNVTRSWRIIQKTQICIFEWSKEPQKRFLAIFASLVCWIDLMLHIVIVLNVFQPSAMLSGHVESFKDHKNVFLNDPKSQERGFWPFSAVWSVGWQINVGPAGFVSFSPLTPSCFRTPTTAIISSHF